MYYPILRGKRHELSAVVELANFPASRRCRPLLEPVNKNTNELISCINDLHLKGISPYVVINPDLGEFSGNGANIFQTLQQNPASAGKFFPCVKILNAFDSTSLSLLQSCAGAAAYLVSDVSAAALPLLSQSDCVFASPLRVAQPVLSAIPRVVLYEDYFAKQRRNADYPDVSFYSNFHFNYMQHPNAVGVADFTVMGEEYQSAGGPAYVVAIHMTYVQRQSVPSLYVKHFCSTTQVSSPANPGGKFLEALRSLVLFDNNNSRFFDRTWGLAQFHVHHSNGHYPGLGIVKELSVEHHMETICNFI